MFFPVFVSPFPRPAVKHFRETIQTYRNTYVTTSMIPYTSLCVASGCTKRTKGYSRFCTKHQHREQSHGHELQEPVTSVHLREPIERLMRWYKTHEGKTAIDAAVEHYKTLAERKVAEYGDDIHRMMETGIKHSSPYYQTTQFIAEVYQSKAPFKTVIELLAFGLLVEESPGMFRNDQAFLFQTTHAYMRRSAAKQKFRFRATHGRAVATTKYLSRKTRTELGRWLTREVVYFGVLIYRQWQKGAAEDKQQRAKVVAAVTGATVA